MTGSARGAEKKRGSKKKGNWSATELARLRELFPRCPERRIAALLNRSVESVRRRARDLFERPARRGAWTADDDRQLRLSHGVLSTKSLALVLARPVREVNARIRELRAHRRRGPWSADEALLLKRIYGSRSDEALEVCLSRGKREIRRMAGELCLSKDKRFTATLPAPARGGKRGMPRWTREDRDLLVTLYPDHDNLEIARRLGRSVTSVANKANQLGLRKGVDLLRDMGRRNVAVRYAASGAGIPSPDSGAGAKPRHTTRSIHRPGSSEG